MELKVPFTFPCFNLLSTSSAELSLSARTIEINPSDDANSRTDLASFLSPLVTFFSHMKLPNGMLILSIIAGTMIFFHF